MKTHAQLLDTAAVLADLRTRVSERCYATSFEGISMRLEDDDTVSISVPTRTGRESLERCYSGEILAALQLLRPSVRGLQFCVASKTNPQPDTSISALTQQIVASQAPRPKRPGETAILRSSGPGVSAHSHRVNAELPLKAEFRLSVFQSGLCNRMAYSAAQTIVESPGSVFNLVYFHGATGLGKTHLLQGIAWALRESGHKTRILYTNCETFANGFIQALQSNSVDAFRALFRSCDVLLVDDIHFLIGKIKTQQEMIATIQLLRNAGKQLVCTGSMNLPELARVDSRLADVLRSGLVERLDAPEFDVRVKMLHNLAARRNWQLNEDVARLLATHIEGNIAHLEGAIQKLFALSRGHGCAPSESLALEALREIGYLRSGLLTLQDILDEVSKHYALKTTEIVSDKRHAEVVRARYVALYLSKNLTAHTVAELARFYGNRDHTSVLYALRKMNSDLKRNDPLKDDVQKLKQALGR